MTTLFPDEPPDETLSRITQRAVDSELRRRTSDKPGLRVPPTIAMQIIAWVVGVLLVYGTINARLSVQEEWRSNTERRLTSIESKIDQLLMRNK